MDDEEGGVDGDCYRYCYWKKKKTFFKNVTKE
jgi:hypothetical protein